MTNNEDPAQDSKHKEKKYGSNKREQVGQMIKSEANMKESRWDRIFFTHDLVGTRA